jgi:peptidyl-prolyl cis-trans isomerase C
MLRPAAVVLALVSTAALGSCRNAADARNSAAPAAAKGASAAAAQPAAGTSATTPAPGAAEQPAPPKPVPQQIPAVVARVNGEDIPRTDFERAVRAIEARAGGPVPAERRDEILRSVLDQLITYRVLAQEAQRRKLAPTEAELQGRLAQLRQQFPNEQAFAQALEQRGLDVKQFTYDTRSDMTVGKLVEEEGKTAPLVSEADAKTFYDQNPEEFKQPEMVRASHVLARFPENGDGAAKQKARAKIEGVLKQAQSGEDFAALARTHSEDGSAQAGGDLNFFSREQMVPAFADAAFKLETGKVSGIVETQFGYHIIKVTERRQARTVPFDEVKDRIAGYLRQQRQQEKTDALIQQLRSKAKIEILI